jgi:hypothetical protein
MRCTPSGLHERLGIDIPEIDYPRLYSLDAQRRI